MKARVDGAREVQRKRYGESAVQCNARMTPAQLRSFCGLSEEGSGLMKAAFDNLGLTARSYDRILKVARTIADLDGSETIEPRHLAEAIQSRSSRI